MNRLNNFNLPGQRILQRIPSVSFDRPLLLISSFNKLVPRAHLRGQSKPTDRFRH